MSSMDNIMNAIGLSASLWSTSMGLTMKSCNATIKGAELTNNILASGQGEVKEGLEHKKLVPAAAVAVAPAALVAAVMVPAVMVPAVMAPAVMVPAVMAPAVTATITASMAASAVAITSVQKLLQILDLFCPTEVRQKIIKELEKEGRRRYPESEEVLKYILDFVYNTEPLEVIVMKPRNGVIYVDDDFYKLDYYSRRYALVINIIEFDQQVRRDGAEEDTQYMINLWEDLGYKVFPQVCKRKVRYTKEEVLSLVNDFRDYCREDEVDASVVFIGSHGFHNYILTSDNQLVPVYQEIVYKFSSDEECGCPEMEGRPKMFIFATCQNHYPGGCPNFDYSINSYDPPRIISKNREIRDAIVILPQTPGKSANRDKFRGTWFVLVFTFVFMHYSHKTSVQDMLKKVQWLCSKIEGGGNTIKQKPVFNEFSFETMYMFPTIYDSR